MKKLLTLFVNSMFLLLCFLGSANAQEIVAISQTQQSSNTADLLQIMLTLSKDTKEIAVSEVSYTTPTSQGTILASSIVISPLKEITNERGEITSKSTTVSLAYGQDKAIRPDYNSVTLKLLPKSESKDGNPYTVNISPSELGKVFTALKDSAGKESLKQQIAERDEAIKQLQTSLSAFKPTLKWNVKQGYNALQFEARSSKDTEITVAFDCNNNDTNFDLPLKANEQSVRKQTFSASENCKISVSEKNPPTIANQQLNITSESGTTFSTLNNESRPFVNPVNNAKALNKTKVTLPLFVSNTDRVEIDVFKEKQGQPPEKITTTSIKQDLSVSCRNRTVDVIGCKEPLEISVPALDYNADYQVQVRAYNTDPLAEPARTTVSFKSLPERFTRSVLVTFTEQGIKFTALTNDVKSNIKVTPYLVTNTNSNPIPQFSSFNSPVAKLNPSANGDAKIWLRELSQQENLGGANATDTTVQTPSKEQSDTRQLLFDIVVTADDGREEKSSVTLAIGKTGNKKSPDVKNFVAKIVGGTASSNPKLEFNTIGGAIASVIGLLIGL